MSDGAESDWSAQMHEANEKSGFTKAKQAAYKPLNSVHTEKALVKDSDRSPFFKGTTNSFNVKQSEVGEEDKNRDGDKSHIFTTYPQAPVIEVEKPEDKIPIHPLVSQMLAKK